MDRREFLAGVAVSPVALLLKDGDVSPENDVPQNVELLVDYYPRKYDKLGRPLYRRIVVADGIRPELVKQAHKMSDGSLWVISYVLKSGPEPMMLRLVQHGDDYLYSFRKCRQWQVQLLNGRGKVIDTITSE